MNVKGVALCAMLFSVAFLSGCKDRKEDVKNGVIYAAGALEQAGANVFSRATFESIIGRGGNAADYVKATLPKEKPVFESFEYGKPTHPYTVVIVQAKENPNEYFIEGYADDLKRPLVHRVVTVNLPNQ